MSKITAYDAADSFPSDGVFLIASATNAKTYKMTLATAAELFPASLNAMNRRNLYQEKSLGSSVTSTQLSNISGGTFSGLFVGNYWQINSVYYDVADMDYWHNEGDTAFTKHHLVIVPRSSLGSAQMNSSNTTEGGYVGSEMYTTNMDTAKATIEAAFGDALLTHREYLTTAVSSGVASAGAWYDSCIELMNQCMCYGYQPFTPACGASVPNQYTIDKQQLTLFMLNPKRLNVRVSFWLRDIVSAANFAFVYGYGNCFYNYASNSGAVRPAFPIGA
ncbi:MAG: hypothetical protein LUI14_14585 [Lachnospiraceae bacterium]|nr:hypothetical protein [Lachnospiraceae bacterium]